jgi:hypothetical protein
MDTDAQLAQYFAGMWPHLDEHARRAYSTNTWRMVCAAMAKKCARFCHCTGSPPTRRM